MFLNLLYLESGFMNFVMRPLGGYFGDVLYRSFGSEGKKIWMLSCGSAMGISLIAGGFYLQQSSSVQRVCYRILTVGSLIQCLSLVPILIGIFCISAIFSELGNGANFALVPHCNASNNASLV